jgi:hypothetical protein
MDAIAQILQTIRQLVAQEQILKTDEREWRRHAARV